MSDQTTKDIALRAACRTNDTQRALDLLRDGANPEFNAACAVLWSARNGNEVLLKAFAHVFAYNHLLPEVLQAGVEQSIFPKLYTQWCPRLASSDHFNLVFAALKARHEKHANFLLDAIGSLNDNQTEQILQRAADGNWAVFDRVALGLTTPSPLLGVVGLLVKHEQPTRLEQIASKVQWSAEHHCEIAAAFAAGDEYYNSIRPFIGAEIASCEPLLRWAVGQNVEVFSRALGEVSQQNIQCAVLFGLLRQRKGKHIQALFERVGYDVLQQHLQTQHNIPNEMLDYFEEQNIARQHQVLRTATQEQSDLAPVRLLKL